MPTEQYVIGVDYGTDSVRSILVNAHNGHEKASSVFYYPRWKEGLYCDPQANRFRQHPLDYIEGLEYTIRDCIIQAGPSVAPKIKAISIDTTGSTPVAVDKTGTPLGLLPGFEDNPNALFVLWKDHTAVKEAAEINAHAEAYSKKSGVNYLQFVGGIYSSEWFWAKLLHIIRTDESVREACYSWVEHCDWIPFLLTGGRDSMAMRRGICSAGHKALFSQELGGLPPDAFFAGLDPLLKGFTQRLFDRAYTADQPAGQLSPEWAGRLGLNTGTVVGIGAFDAHMGAVGGQIEPYHLSKVMGTSTCDMLVAPLDEVRGRLIKGICGQVPGSVIPGMMGMEAGQSAFGDAYAWFRDLLAWPLQHLLAASPKQPASPAPSIPSKQSAAPAPAVSLVYSAVLASAAPSGAPSGTPSANPPSPVSPDLLKTLIAETLDRIIPALSREAATLPVPEEQEPLALDWFNGRRTPDANQLLKGALTGLGLGSDAPRIFRAIVEATCFGAKAIVDRFIAEGVPVKGIIGLGGVAKKSPFIMQTMADILQMPIRIHRSEQTCALGAAMFAATAAGLYPTVEQAMASMGQGFDTTCHPDPGRAQIYARRYKAYQALGGFAEKQLNA